MIPQLETIPKQREFESDWDLLKCPYCHGYYSIGVYLTKKFHEDMKCDFCGKEWKEDERMTHHCPLCGTELELWVYEDPISLEKSAGIFAYGCRRCCLMLQGQCSYDMSEEEKEAFAETLYPAWLDSIDRSELVRTVRTENVLRAAYGMKEVNASDVAFRDFKRRIDAMKVKE